MPSYAAFIGHQPHLSLAELAATVPGFLLHEKIDRAAVLFDSAIPLDAAFLDTLGGTVILAEKLDGTHTVENVPGMLSRILMNVKGKATFSLRTMGVPPHVVQELYRKTKNELKKKGKPSRYVGNERKAAPSVVLRDNKLLDGTGGAEMAIIQYRAKSTDEPALWMGRTVGAQDIDSYTERDMEKPVRDTTVGLLPPKLAQIMINLGLWLTKKSGPGLGTGPKKKTPSPDPPARRSLSEGGSPVIYDPFCGTGVIPMECLIRGFPVLASDKSEKAVTGCTKNLDWLRKKREIKKSEVPSRVWKQDATKAMELKESAGLIVTETSLGPALEKRPTSKDVQKLRSENEKLQADFLRNIAETLPGVPLVCTWPVWYPTTSPVALERIWKVVDELGYQAVLPPTIEIVGDRVSLLYRRPDQFVGRELVMLRPKRH